MGAIASSSSKSKPWYKEIGVILGLIVFALTSIHQGIGPAPAIFAVLTAVLASAIIIVPTFHYGVHEFLGRRTGRVSLEGPTFAFPFLVNIILVSCELKRIAFEVIFTSNNKQEIKMKGELQYRADPNISRDGKNVHAEISVEILTSGINEAIESKIAALGGSKDLIDFIRDRKAIEDYLNCAFRLEEAPHLNHDISTCGVAGCTLPNYVMADKLTDYYNSHQKLVRELLKTQDSKSNSHSAIELRYGIDVVSLPFGTITFSEETKKSMEKLEQVSHREEAYKTKIAMIRKAMRTGATFQEASDAADCALEPQIAANKKIISVEGSLLGAFLSGATNEPSQKSNPQKKRGG